ncbi:MAG TPA: hypothetical protein VM491_01070 [Burkholderiaceae bacterium]|nr:hypothetical protein [Burkholderiaceae bacterium]
MAGGSETSRLKHLYDQVRSAFFIAPDLDELFALGDSRSARFEPAAAACWSRFRSRIVGLIAALEVPYELAHAGVMDRLYQQFADPAMAAPALFADDPTTEAGAARLERARRDARHKVEEFRSATIGRNHIVESIGVFLMRATAEAPFAASARQLLLQGTVLCWAAYEGLASDCAVHALDGRPLPDPDAIAAAYAALAPDRALLRQALEAADLRLLFARQRTICRGATIDAEYAASAQLSADAIGTPLRVPPAELQAHLRSVIAAAIEIVDAVDRHARSQPPTVLS